MSDLLCSAKLGATTLALLLSAASLSAQASVTPDRTRLIFNESDKSISVTLRNNDPKLPYLAQSWIEDEKGNKISSPLTVSATGATHRFNDERAGKSAGNAGYQQIACRS